MRERLRRILGWWPAWVIAAFGFAAYATLSLTRWNRLSTPSWDLGIFEQVVRGWAEHGAPIVDIKGPGFNQLGDHFSPILAVLAPFHWIWPSPVMLLMAQCVLVALSIVIVAVAAYRHLGTWQGVCLGFAYAVSWGLQTGVNVQFHEYAFAAPIIALSLAYYLDRNWLASAWWMAALLLVKEDLGFTVIVYGLLLFIQGRMRISESGVRDDASATAQQFVGMWLAIIGTAATLLIFFVIIPAFNPDHAWDYWNTLGSSEPKSVGDWIVGVLGEPDKWETVGWLGFVVLFVWLRSPLAVLLVPTMAWRFLSDNEFHWGTGWHYSLPLMPIVFLATVEALVALRYSKWNPLRALALALPALAAAVGVFSLTQFPLSELAQPETYQPSPRAGAAETVIAAIPNDASVVSDLGLLNYLTENHQVFWMGTPGDEIQPDYIVIDAHSWWSADPGDAAYYAMMTYGGIYQDLDLGQAVKDAGFRVARRV